MPVFGDKKKSSFDTDIVLGQKYRNKHTGFIGTAIAVYFYEHACERVCLTGMNGHGEVVEYVFDALEVETVATAKTGGPHDRSAAPETPRSAKTGGPHSRSPVRR
jgi:hypothetical protein